MTDLLGTKRALSSDESNDSEEENEGFKKLSKNTKRKKISDESGTFLSPEKITVEEEKLVCEFKTPEKVPAKSSCLKEETTPVKEPMELSEKGSPSGWSLSSNLSLTIDGDEEDLMSKVEQARRLISSANSSPERLNRTPQKNSISLSAVSNRLGASPKTPNKTRRVELITIASPKSKKTL